jgi:hypothetical protein
VGEEETERHTDYDRTQRQRERVRSDEPEHVDRVDASVGRLSKTQASRANTPRTPSSRPLGRGCSDRHGP